MDLVGADLVGHVHDEVAVHHAIDQPADQANGPVEAGVLLQPEGQGEDGHKGQPRLVQSLAEHVDVVGSPAAAAGLGDEQGHLMGVIPLVLDGVNHLADDQQSGVAGVIVDVFQAALHHGPAVVVEDGHLVPRPLQQLGEEAEVNGQHLGDENGIFLAHLLGEEKAAGLVVL